MYLDFVQIIRITSTISLLSLLYLINHNLLIAVIPKYPIRKRDMSTVSVFGAVTQHVSLSHSCH